MWLEFIAAAIAIALLLFVPGYFLVRCFGAPRCQSLCFAPIISISILCIVGQIVAFTGAAVWQPALAGAICIVPILAFVGLRKKVSSLPMPHIPWWNLIVYTGIGCILGIYLFLGPLTSADTIFQAFDITKHLNLIQAFADSGHYSSLGTNVYLAPSDQAINPYPSAGFYPAAWHILCALVVAITGITTPIVINASMFVFCSLVFPLSVLVFLSCIFPGQKKTVLCGGFVCLAFVSFPWNLLIFGPVYPNVAGFATVPSAAALFILLFQTVEQRLTKAPSKTESEDCIPIQNSGGLKLLTLFLLACIGQALHHPNTIFSCFAILAAFCITRVWRICTARGLTKVLSSLVCIGISGLFALIWYACFKLPFLNETVMHSWPLYAGKFQAIVNVLTQTYTLHFFSETAAQIALGFLVVFGFVKALHSPRYRWIAYSYLLVCFILIQNAISSDYLKQLLSGFWYTDPMRLASLAVLAAIPLAALGLAWTCDAILLLTKKYNQAHHKTTHPAKVQVVVFCVFLAVNFMPSFDLPGKHIDKVANPDAVTKKPIENQSTTFGDYRAMAAETFSYNSPLSKQERLFLQEAKNFISDDSLVINNPMDGSFLAYGAADIRTYYRDFSSYDGDAETAESKVIRNSLYNLSSDDRVRDAVRAIGARYVIVLDQSDSKKSFIDLRNNYKPDQFSGITSITNETPGFSCIFEKEGLKLYEIIE